MKSQRSGRSAQTTIPAGQFKTHCLQLMDEVAESGRELVITKHGKPVAKLVPVVDGVADSWGSMKGTVTYLDEDIVSPDHDAWAEADD